MIIFLIPTTFMNNLKPLTPYKDDIFGLRYLGYLTQQPSSLSEGWMDYRQGVGWSLMSANQDRLGLRHLLRPQDEECIRTFDRIVPREERVGIIFTFYQWDFPLFGPDLTRTIVPLNINIIKNEKFNYIVASDRALELNPPLKDSLMKNYVVEQYLGWMFSGGNVRLYRPKIHKPATSG